jgi:hypothetical protein
VHDLKKERDKLNDQIDELKRKYAEAKHPKH